MAHCYSFVVVLIPILFPLNALNSITIYDTLFVHSYSEINVENTNEKVDEVVEGEFMGLHNAFYVDDEHCDEDEDIIISIKRQ